MEDAEPLVFTKSMQEPCDWFGIGNGVFQFSHAIGHVGVGVGHAAKAHVMDARFMGQPHFFDDVLGRSPNWNAFLGLDAKLAPPLVANTALVDLHFVGQRSWLVLRAEVGMLVNRFAAGPCLSPSRPLFGRPALVLPFTVVEEMMQGCVGILNGEEKIGAERCPPLLLPTSNGPSTKERRCSIGKVSNEGLRFFEGNWCASKVLPRYNGPSDADDSQTTLQASFNAFRVVLQRLTVTVDRHVIVRGSGCLEHTTDVANMETDVGGNAKRSGLIFVAVQDQPAWLGRFNHASRGRGVAFNPSLGGGVACASFHRRLLPEEPEVHGQICPRCRHHGFHHDHRLCHLWTWRCRP